MHSVAGFLLKVWLPAVFIIGIWRQPVQCSCQTPDLESVVRQRVDGYWAAVQKGDYQAAAGFVHPDSRNDFIYRMKKGPVTSWKTQAFRFNEDRTVCTVSVLVTRPVGWMGYQDLIDWQTDNQWQVLPDGQWYQKFPPMKDNLFAELWGGGVDPNLKPVLPPGTASDTASKPAPPIAKPRRLTPDPANPGKVQRGDKGIFRYQFENGTAVPIKAVSAKVDGKFISFSGLNAEVLPGRTGAVEMIVDAFGMPDGPIQKEVLIQFSDIADPFVVMLRTEIVPNFVLTPAAVDFGNLTLGKSADVAVRILNRSGKRVKLLSVQKFEPQLSVTPDKMEILPGESFLVTVRCTPSVEGAVMDSALLRTDLAAEPMIPIQVRGRITR